MHTDERDALKEAIDNAVADKEASKLKLHETSYVSAVDFIAEYFTDGQDAWFYKQYKAPHPRAGEVERVNKLPTEDFKGIYVPYNPVDSMATCCLWPSDFEEYGTEMQLFEEICAFIHKWVEIPLDLERLAALYVMYTYCYESYREAPYLRVLGDLGSGKTRLSIDVLGQIVYRPIRTIAASSMASIFRSLSDIKGTLVLDEADMNDKSDKSSEIVQLLNSGYKKGVALLRVGESSSGTGGKRGYKTEQFHVFGPKIICSREHMRDEALESRCIPIAMSELTRHDIPLFTDDTIETDGQRLRNKLYKWRYDTRGLDRIARIDHKFLKMKMSSRIKQLFMILSSAITDTSMQAFLYAYGEKIHHEASTMRGDSVQGLVLEVVKMIYTEHLRANMFERLVGGEIEVRVPTVTVARKVNEIRIEHDNEISGRYVSRILRETCGFRPYREKTFRGNIIGITQLNNMLERHGIEQIDLSEYNIPLNKSAASDSTLPKEVRDIAREFGASPKRDEFGVIPVDSLPL